MPQPIFWLSTGLGWARLLDLGVAGTNCQSQLQHQSSQELGVWGWIKSTLTCYFSTLLILTAISVSWEEWWCWFWCDLFELDIIIKALEKLRSPWYLSAREHLLCSLLHFLGSSNVAFEKHYSSFCYLLFCLFLLVCFCFCFCFFCWPPTPPPHTHMGGGGGSYTLPS